MARQRSLHLVLGFACSLAAVGCDDSDDKFGMLDSGVLAPPGSTAGTGATGAAAGGTTGITTPGGTTGMTLPGGTTGTTLPGGTTGMTTPGGTTGMSMPGGTTGMTTPGGTTGMTTPGGTTGMTMPGGTTGITGSPTGGPGGMGPPPPAKLSAEPGPLAGGGGILNRGNTFELPDGVGTVYYPMGDGPWPGVAIIPGFTNVGPEMEEWGPFLASWGIVTVVTNSGALDTPSLRGGYLGDAIKALKAENTKEGSPLKGKMSGAYGTSGYSMGGGGTSLASIADKTLKSSVGLAPWTPEGEGVTTPTLHFCGDVDVVADCSHAQFAYDRIPDSTPKMMITVGGCDHLFCWFGPADTPNGVSGGWALAFHKVYLENDLRWKPLLLQKPDGCEVQTNIE